MDPDTTSTTTPATVAATSPPATERTSPSVPLASPPRRLRRPATPATAPTSLVQTSLALWALVPLPPTGSEDGPALPRVGPVVSTSLLLAWINAGQWDEVAARWPSLDPSQRVSTLYALNGTPLPPGYAPLNRVPSDWLVAMALISHRSPLLNDASVSLHQWETAWRSPVDLLPAGLRRSTAGDWARSVHVHALDRHQLRHTVLDGPRSRELPFGLVWEMAEPLTRHTAEAVSHHPDASTEALRAALEASPRSPQARARLAADRRFPAGDVVALYRAAEPEELGPLLDTTIPRRRLLALLEQRFDPSFLRSLVRSQKSSRSLAMAMRASAEALTALFQGLDVSSDAELCEAALSADRPEARCALAAAVTDPGVLARLAADPDPRVRELAARRVLAALAPTDDEPRIPLAEGESR